MKQTRPWLAMIAALLCSLTASAYYDFGIDGVYYNITSSTDLTLEVTYRGDNYNSFSDEYTGDVTIPETVTDDGNTYRVTSIGDDAFHGCSSLKTITIPESVTSIGDDAFHGCSSLTAITIPESVTSIGEYAFYGCTGELIVNCNIRSVSNLRDSPFYGSKFSKVTIGNKVTSIGDYAFHGCSSLTAINIPESVTEIGDYAFSGCSSLTAITIPESVTSIGERAFSSCTSLTTITIPENSQLTSIGEKAFYNCSSLTAITIPESVTSIGEYAFYGCTGELIVNCNIRSVSNLRDSPFYGSKFSKVTIGNKVTSIGDYAFYDCSSLTAINIPESVTEIGEYAFYGCSSLTAINIPESVTEIGEYTFYECTSLTSITIPESVTKIDNCAFKYCTSLKEVIIKDSGETLYLGYNDQTYNSNFVGQGLFSSCPLETIYLGRNLSYSNGQSSGYSPFYNKTNLTSITIGDKVTSIEKDAFRGCSSLTTITIPEGVTQIGSSAFYDCSSLTAINIPESVTEIDEYTFRGCSSLTSITIPENVTSISICVFQNCTSLKEVIFEDGSTTLSLGYEYHNSGIYYGLFCDCPLESVYLGRNLSFYSDQSYGYSPFYNKTDLTSITIGDKVTNIEDYTFYQCGRNLISIVVAEGNSVYDSRNECNAIIETNSNTLLVGCSATIIPKDVKSIEERAFYDCRSLISITIPKSVTSIGGNAFQYCTSLKEIVIEDGSETLSLGYNFDEHTGVASSALFSACPLETVYLGRDLSYTSGKSYGYSPFYGYNKEVLCHVTIGREVTAIEEYAFYGCDNISSLTINSGVRSIGSNAFGTLDKVIWLTNTPPTGYTNANGRINYVANSQYSNLSNVKVYPYLSSMFEMDGVKYVPVSPSERTCHAIDCVYDNTVNEFSIDETIYFKGVEMKVTEVMPYTFFDNDYVKKVSIANLGNIGNYAFYDCDSLETAIVANLAPIVSLNDSIPLTLEDWTSTNKTNGSTSSNTYTFTAKETTTLSFDWSVSSESGFDKLFVILDGTTILEKSGFGNGTYSNEISYGEHILTVKYTKDASNSDGYDQASVSNIVVPKGSNSPFAGVGNEAFSGCSSLKIVTLGDSIGSLGSKAFYHCTSLEKIIIPGSVEFIGGYCFSGCSAMKKAEMGDGVTTINDYAFQNCSSLSEITIPYTVTTIGDNVFAGCSSLSNVTVVDRTEPLTLGSNDGSSALFADCPLDSVYIGGKIIYSTSSDKGYSPFYRNTSLHTVVITDREEQIYDNEFYGCTALKNVTIGNGVKSIGNYAFSGCSSLEGFSFGSNMETIGEEAFSDCTNLTSITSHAAVPPTCGTQALDDINKWDCVLGVPLGNAEAYYAADQWKEFFFIEDVVEVDHYILTYVVDGEVVHTEVLKHKDEVTMLAEPSKVGYTFSGWDKTLTTMPAEDVTISGTFTMTPVENLIIRDDERDFAVDEEVECKMVTYVRSFEDAEWQTLYVPFKIPYENICEAFEVAYLNNVRQYDHDDDGVKDETVIEAFKMKEGVLEANYPYLIRAKETGEKLVVLPGTALYATEEVSLDCSSIFDTYTFTGTYSSLSSAELPQGEGYYTLIDGEWQPVTEDVSLGAFRFYLKVDSRSGAQATQARNIRMRIVDKNGGDDVTGLDKSEFNIHNSEIIYDLQGRCVESPTKTGIYIVNGRKVVIE